MPHADPNQFDMSDEWYTPSKYLSSVRHTFGGGIDLDPASSAIANQTVQAKTYWAQQDDGLTKPWFGSVFLNPPYSTKLIRKFVDKLLSESNHFYEAIVLVNSKTETYYYQKLLTNCNALHLTDHRIRFNDHEGNPSSSPRAGNTFFYFGAGTNAFEGAFKPIGGVTLVL